MRISSFIAGAAVGMAVSAVITTAYWARFSPPVTKECPATETQTAKQGVVPAPAPEIQAPAPEPQAPVDDKSAEAAFRACFAEATGIQERLKMKIERGARNKLESMEYSGQVADPAFSKRIWKAPTLAAAKNRTTISFLYEKAGQTILINSEWDGTTARAYWGKPHTQILPAQIEPGRDYRLSVSSETGDAPPSANRPVLDAMLLKIMSCGQQYSAGAR